MMRRGEPAIHGYGGYVHRAQGSALPAAWNPSFWFDADHGVTADGSGVSAVADRYGGIHSLSQATSGNRPALVDWRGRKAFQAASGDYLDMTELDLPRPYTMFVVSEFPSSATATYYQPFWGGPTTPNSPSPLVWGGYLSSPNVGSYGGASTVNITNLSGFLRSEWLNIPFVFCLQQIAASSLVTWRVIGHGKTILSASDNHDNPASDFVDAHPRVANTTPTTSYWPKPVACVAATLGTLSAGDRDAKMQDLANYYGIVPL